MTPLHVAATAGHSQTCVSILESLDPDTRARAMAETERASGENVLHLACAEGRARCVEAIFREVRIPLGGSAICSYLRYGVVLMRAWRNGVGGVF